MDSRVEEATVPCWPYPRNLYCETSDCKTGESFPWATDSASEFDLFILLPDLCQSVTVYSFCPCSMDHAVQKRCRIFMARSSLIERNMALSLPSTCYISSCSCAASPCSAATSASRRFSHRRRMNVTSPLSHLTTHYNVTQSCLNKWNPVNCCTFWERVLESGCLLEYALQADLFLSVSCVTGGRNTWDEKDHLVVQSRSL